MPFARSLRSQSLLLFGGSLLLMLLIALAGFGLLARWSAWWRSTTPT